MSSSIDFNDIEKSKKYDIVQDFISKTINHEKLNEILDYLNEKRLSKLTAISKGIWFWLVD